MKTFKDLFFGNIKKYCEKEKNIGVALSAGKDSTAILLALLELGYNPTAYSFHVDGVMSTDFVLARENCNKLNVPFVECILPALANKKLVVEYITKYDRCLKVEVECQYPYYFLLPKVKEKILLIGLSAGTMLPLSKKVCIHYKHDKEKLNHWRDGDYEVDINDLRTFNRMSEDMGLKVAVRDPFFSEDMLAWFKEQSWDSLHKPQQKQVLIDLFPEKWKELEVIKQTSLQCGDSMIRETYEHLLEDRNLNYRRRTRMLDLYRDINERSKLKETIFW